LSGVSADDGVDVRLHLRIAFTTLSVAALIAGTAVVVVPFVTGNDPVDTDAPPQVELMQSDQPRAPVAAAPGSASVSPGASATAVPAATTNSLGGGDNGLPTDISGVITRAYTSCRIWSRNGWPRGVTTVASEDQVYRSHGEIFQEGSRIGYAFNVFSNQEIRSDKSLGTVEIVLEVTSPYAPVTATIFYLRYELTSGFGDALHYDLVDAQCR
jgi:hypothetical protein